jgi:hypothetical protein
MNITYSECVSVALIVQQGKRMCYVVLSSVACLTILQFPHYLTNGMIFDGKNIVNKA